MISKILKNIRRKLKEFNQKCAPGRFAVAYITLTAIAIVIMMILFVAPTLQKRDGWIGVEVRQDATSATLVANKVLPGSPAEAVGIAAGDKLLSYNGKPISDINTLKQLIRNSYIRQSVRIILDRNGTRLVADTRIAKKPTDVTVLPPVIPIMAGTPCPHVNRGLCINCHTLVPASK